MKVKELVILSSILILASTSGFGQEGRKGGPPNVDELIAKMDTNKDGKLSLDEVDGPLKKDFDTIDTNKDGFLTKEEIEAAPKPKRGQRPPR